MEPTLVQGSKAELANEKSIPSQFEIKAKPSDVIRHHHTTISLDGANYPLTLITMKRSFLLVINNVSPAEFRIRESDDGLMSREEIITCFMEDNLSLRGLSLAIGEHSTCLIDSENSLASATLATRLSKKLNMNRPVYVANNLHMSHHTIDTGSVLSSIYLKIFQFVSAHYKVEAGVTQ